MTTSCHQDRQHNPILTNIRKNKISFIDSIKILEKGADFISLESEK
jgi:hypothetical protein